MVAMEGDRRGHELGRVDDRATTHANRKSTFSWRTMVTAFIIFSYTGLGSIRRIP